MELFSLPSSSLSPLPGFLHAHSSLWAYSASSKPRAAEVWAAKLTCRHTGIQIFRAQHYLGVHTNMGVCNTWHVQEHKYNLSTSVHRQREAGGRERRNIDFTKLLCTVPGAMLSFSPKYQSAWVQGPFSIGLHLGRN